MRYSSSFSCETYTMKLEGGAKRTYTGGMQRRNSRCWWTFRAQCAWTCWQTMSVEKKLRDPNYVIRCRQVLRIVV